MSQDQYLQQIALKITLKGDEGEALISKLLVKKLEKNVSGETLAAKNSK